MSRPKANLAVENGELVWIDRNTAEEVELPEAFLARYMRRTKTTGQPNQMDLAKVVNSTPIDRTARLVSEQSQSVSLQ
jgi:propanediol dehydratase large subunit